MMLLTRRLETHLTIPTNANDRLLQEADNYLGISIGRLEKLKVFRMMLPSATSVQILEEVFVDPIMEKSYWTDELSSRNSLPNWTVEIQYRPGVTDNVARSAEEALALMGIENSRVATGIFWLIYGDCVRSDVEKFALELLANDLIQKVDVRSYEETIHWKRFEEVRLPIVKLEVLTTIDRCYDYY